MSARRLIILLIVIAVIWFLYKKMKG